MPGWEDYSALDVTLIPREKHANDYEDEAFISYDEMEMELDKSKHTRSHLPYNAGRG